MKISAGLLMYRIKGGQLEIFLAHPGGPFFAKKDLGAWSIPKGEVSEGEDQLSGAKREFQEETGITPSQSNLIELGEIKQKGGKIIHAWAFENDFNGEIKSNSFEMEWPPRSGKRQQFPEIDRAQFFDLETARQKIIAEQWPLIERLIENLK